MTKIEIGQISGIGRSLFVICLLAVSYTHLNNSTSIAPRARGHTQLLLKLFLKLLFSKLPSERLPNQRPFPITLFLPFVPVIWRE